MTQAELERLAAMDVEIAERVVNLPPETFDRYLGPTTKRSARAEHPAA